MKINIKRPRTVRSQSRWFPKFNLELRKPIYGNHNNMFFKQTGCCYRLTPYLTKQFNLNRSAKMIHFRGR